jgi:phosphatidyl-myo-inositol alpha-mannosyltransferase
LADISTNSTASVLRIALVCPFSLSRPGGVQGQILGLARCLTAAGHEVTVFAPADDEIVLPDGVEVVVTGHSVSLPANGSKAPVTVSPRAVRRALRAIRVPNFDVVHVHEPFAPGVPYGLLVGRKLPPLVVTFHRSGNSPFYAALGPLTKRLSRRFMVRCAVSDAARATAFAAVGGHYEVGFNGIEVSQYEDVVGWPNGRPTILFLGRHEERKGLRVLLEAFDLMGAVPGTRQPAPETGPVLWIAGDGPETDELQRLFPESDSIRWLGMLSEEEKIRRLVGADVVALPSIGGESFGIVLLEAMAARTTVVASDIDGYRAASGGHAVLVPVDDPEAWAEALSGVLDGSLGIEGAAGDDPHVGRERWLDGAKAWAEHWSMGELADWYVPIYRRAVVMDAG